MIIGVDEMMGLYGYAVPEDPDELRAERRKFQAFKKRNKHLFPESVAQGKWLRTDVEKHLTEKRWLNKKPSRRIRPAASVDLRLC